MLRATTVRTMVGAMVAFGLAGAVGAAPPAEKPAPEMERLAKLVGTWDAVMKMKDPAGGAKELEIKGMMVWKSDLGGAWVTGEFKSDFFGMPFHGRSFDTWDATSKKYSNVWIDSMGPKPTTMEGTFDEKSATLTMTGEGPGHDGKPVKVKSTSVFKDADTIVFTMTMTDSGGMSESFTITYTRKK